jgi:hypothetical protein
MKLFKHHFDFSQLIFLTIVAGGIGGIISGAYPRIGTAMAIIGVIGSLLNHFTSEMHNREIDSLMDAQALLLASKGVGNLYTEAGTLELKRGGTKAVGSVD